MEQLYIDVEQQKKKTITNKKIKLTAAGAVTFASLTLMTSLLFFFKIFDLSDNTITPIDNTTTTNWFNHTQTPLTTNTFMPTTNHSDNVSMSALLRYF